MLFDPRLLDRALYEQRRTWNRSVEAGGRCVNRLDLLFSLDDNVPA
jgi:hypothetical protein